jgi:hypothetical protein
MVNIGQSRKSEVMVMGIVGVVGSEISRQTSLL